VVFALGALAGCETRPKPSPLKTGVSAETTSRYADVVVAFARNGQRGDLASLLASRPGFPSQLAAALIPTRTMTGENDRSHWFGAYFIGGASYSPRAGLITLYAHELDEVFVIAGGRLVETSGESMPVRIVLSEQPLHVESIDMPADGEGYGASVARMMPSWAADRLDQLDTDWDTRALRDAAGRWSKRSGLLARFISISRPHHADPHHHVPSVYGLRVIPPGASGLSVHVVHLWEVPRHPNLGDFEMESTSSDGRFVYYWPISGYWSGLLIRDQEKNRWLHVGGPQLDLPMRVTWVGTTLVFDVADVGFGEPRTRKTTITHVEVDLERPAIERVVPIGSYTGN
jgi:hypothetical protein